MRMVMHGYTWPIREGVTPALLTASQCYYPSMATNRRCQQSVWVLDYVFSGISEYRLSPASVWKPRLPNTAHLYAPHTPYWERQTGIATGNMCSAYILFTGGEAAGLAPLLHPTERYAEFDDAEQLLGPLLRTIADIGHNMGRDGFWAAQAHFCTILHHMHRGILHTPGQFRLAGVGEHPGISDFAHTVNSYLQAHLAERITLAEIAAELQISASTLSHRYRAETGISPMRHLQTLRVAAVKVLLQQGFPLKDIAVMTGFCDAFHLSKAFKHHTGSPPRAYLAYQPATARGQHEETESV